MRKTLFSGITVLNPDESVTTDNGAFIGRDRDTIDRLLEIGAKTHRHDGSLGIGDPVSPMGASAIASAGSISANQTFSLAYTLEDDQGGETLLAPSVTFSTPSPINPPFAAPAGEAVYGAGGDLPVDTYYYAFSFVDAGGGETPIGPAKAVEREPGFPEAKVTLSGMSAPVASAGAAGWRMYRAVGGGDFGYLASGTGNTFLDDGSAQANCDLTPLSDSVNTTNGDNSIIVKLPSADAFVAKGQNINVYLTNSGDFIGDALLDTFPVSSAGKSVVYPSVNLLSGQPPDVSTSIGGASMIDPDTELLDWHWLRPVASSGALGSGTKGDVRFALDTGRIYGVLGASAGVATDWSFLTTRGTEVFSSGSAAPGATENRAERLEVFGSAGVNVKGTEPSKGTVKLLVEGQSVVLANEGMGVLICTVAEKGRTRPKAFKQYTWFCKEQPTNLANFDIWIEEGP